MVRILPFLVLKMKKLTIRTQITSCTESSSLEKYLKDLAKCNVLNVDDEVAAFKELELLNPEHKKLPDQLEEFDKETQWKIEKLVEKISKANLRFVVSVAKQYNQYKIPLQDLINEWNIWLIRAIYRFDYKRWFKFISYAVWRIRQTILQHIAENGSIRIPISQNRRINTIQKYIDTIGQTEHRTPTNEEIKKELFLNDSEFKHYLDAVSAVNLKSLDKKIYDDEDSDDLKSLIKDTSTKSPDFEIEQDSTKQAILSILDKKLKSPSKPWKPDPKKIIYLYYYENKSLQEIADYFDITREHVKQIINRSLKILKHDGTLRALFDTLNE